MDIGRLISVHSRTICFALALIFSFIFVLHIAFWPLTPIADGAGYVTRAFALYGFLHTGQWSHFLDLLRRPHQSICPPHQLLFFALPTNLAGPETYLALQIISTYLLLALAVFDLTKALDRPGWAPFIFILCGVNNVALTDFYAFYLDMPFLAFSLWVIARQMKAWKQSSVQASFVAGLGLGFLFLIKPANALIFLWTYLLSELIHAWFVYRRENDRPHFISSLMKHWLWILAGFSPVLIVALALGGAQSILLLIDQNEVQQAVTPLAAKGLLRLFYFPLCLSAYYHAVILGSLLLTSFCVGKWIFNEKGAKTCPTFPVELFLPVLFSYLILGQFFSFWVLVKALRSLLLVLPLFWILTAWLWERSRTRVEPLLFVAFLYAALAFSQKEFDIFQSKGQLLEDTYQLRSTSWCEMPSAWRRNPSLSQVICDLVRRDLPPRQIICINSIELRNSLSWQLENGELLMGKTPSYEVRNLFNYKGEYYYKSLVDSNLLILITFFPGQKNKLSLLETAEFADYAYTKWCVPGGLAQMKVLPMIQEQPIGYEITFANPLSSEQVERVNASSFGNLARAEGYGAESVYGHHYSWAEAVSLLRAWYNARL